MIKINSKNNNDNIKAKTPLYDGLKKYNALGRSRFHTPGHKGKIKGMSFELDFTELPLTDNLYAPNGIIAKAERQAALYFGAQKTLFSAGGNTLCIQAMLKLAHRGKKMLVHRLAHVSVINTMALLDIVPVWIYEQRINAKTVENLLKKHDADAIFVTSPDYYGYIQDIGGLAEVCLKYNVPLLVDNAHGSHLKAFGLHPISHGAAMTACSAHKTLPVLTGGAFLNINDKAFAEDAIMSMKLFSSTSPSYLILASLDKSIKWLMEDGADEMRKTAQKVEHIKNIAEERGIDVLKGQTDPLKLTLLIDGDNAYKHFEEHHIEPEMTDSGHAVFMCSPFNSDEDFICLQNAVTSLIPNPPQNVVLPKPYEMCLTPREAAFKKSYYENTEKCLGKIAAESPFLCPPGVPLIIAGEKITAEVIENAINGRIFKIKVVQ